MQTSFQNFTISQHAHSENCNLNVSPMGVMYKSESQWNKYCMTMYDDESDLWFEFQKALW